MGAVFEACQKNNQENKKHQLDFNLQQSTLARQSPNSNNAFKGNAVPVQHYYNHANQEHSQNQHKYNSQQFNNQNYVYISQEDEEIKQFTNKRKMMKQPASDSQSEKLTQGYIWVDNKLMSQEKDHIQKQSGLDKIILCRSVEEAQKQCAKYDVIIMISSLRLSEDVQKAFKKQKKVKTILCYCMDTLMYDKFKKEGKLGNKFVYCTNNQIELINFLKNNSYRQFF